MKAARTLGEFWRNYSGVVIFTDKNGILVDDLDYPLATKVLDVKFRKPNKYTVKLDVEKEIIRR